MYSKQPKKYPKRRGRYVKNRIWICVDGIEIHNLRAGQEPAVARGTLAVGSKGFLMHNVRFGLEDNDRIVQNHAIASLRLLDVPAWHLKRIPKILLETVIAKAAFELLTANKEKLKSFLATGQPTDIFSYREPSDWKGNLHIPVEFIRIYSFGYDGGRQIIRANVQVGHHLVFWHVPVFNPQAEIPAGCVTNDIKDKRIIKTINETLSRSEIQKHLAFLSAQKAFDERTEYLKGIPSVNPDAPRRQSDSIKTKAVA